MRKMKLSVNGFKEKWRERNRRSVEGINTWDLVIYDIGNGIEEGAVLDTYADDYSGEIRTDTDGNISVSDILYVIKGAGKQNVYDTESYRESESYRLHLFNNYDLALDPSGFSLR